MYPEWVLGLLTLAAFVWLLVLTYWFKNEVKFFKSIFPKSGERDIRQKFIEVLKDVSEFRSDLDKFDSKLKDFEKAELKHVQRVALKRYNPYNDTGGNISFSLALLDKNGDGFVLTSLHARSGTRVFAKPVTGGGNKDIELSKEETQTVEEAMRFKIKSDK